MQISYIGGGEDGDKGTFAQTMRSAIDKPPVWELGAFGSFELDLPSFPDAIHTTRTTKLEQATKLCCLIMNSAERTKEALLGGFNPASCPVLATIVFLSLFTCLRLYTHSLSPTFRCSSTDLCFFFRASQDGSAMYFDCR